MNKNKFDKLITKTPVVCLLAMLCCLLWGSAFPCIKIGYSMLNIAADDTMSQLLFAGIRFTLAGILTVIFGSIISRKLLLPKLHSVGSIIKLSLIQTVMQYVFFYIGLANTTGVKSSIIEAANVFIAIFVSCLIFRFEKLTVSKVIGCVVGFTGVVIINLVGSSLDFSFTLAGEGAVLISCAAYGLSSCMIKNYSKSENPVVLSGYQFFIGGLLLILTGFMFGGRISGFTPSSVGLMIYMAIISSVAYTIWGILLKYNPVGKVAVFGFTNPIFGVILSAWLLGENNQAFTPQGIIALVLVSAGIFIVNKKSE